MSHLLIVGQKFSTLTAYLAQHGHTYTQLRDVAKTKHPDKSYKDSILTDFSSWEGIETALAKLSTPPDGVIATYENYILAAAQIAEELDLPGLPVKAAEACTDKYVMRGLFAQAPEKISPDFAIVTNVDELKAFAAQHNFPLILKPTNLAKSLLVTKNHSMEELLANYGKSLDLLHGVYKKFAPNRNPQLLVEEFLEGSIHSVDAFIDSDGNPAVLEQVVDYQTGYDIGFDDNFHYSRILPSKLSSAEQAALRHCAEVGARALGMKNSPAHIEVIMTKAGPRIVEIGARNGGYRERMHWIANGIDITGGALALRLGQKPVIAATKNDDCAVLELFPKIPGTFAGLAQQAKLEKLPSLNYLSVKAKEGEFVGKAGDGYKMCAVVILHHSDHQQFQKDLDFVNTSVAVITK
jgi:biotin carboxylase